MYAFFVFPGRINNLLPVIAKNYNCPIILYQNYIQFFNFHFSFFIRKKAFILLRLKAFFRHPCPQRAHVLGGQAAEFGLECPAEGAHIGETAGAADLRQGQVRVPHHQAGLVNADGVDKVAEIRMHFF